MTPFADDKLSIIREHFQPYSIIIGAGGIVVGRSDRDSQQCKEREENLDWRKMQRLVGLKTEHICHIILKRVMI